MAAAHAGAAHVTAVEPRLYLAAASSAVATLNGVGRDRLTVAAVDYCELDAHQDVRMPCNVLVANLMDDGAVCWCLFAPLDSP